VVVVVAVVVAKVLPELRASAAMAVRVEEARVKMEMILQLVVVWPVVALVVMQELYKEPVVVQE
jgi:hypothetical protein